MSVRETIQRKPRLMGTVAFVVSVLAGLAVARQINAPKVTLPPQQLWYTADEGKTWFVDSADRITPFDHNGKSAVRAVLFTCDGGKTMFLGYLERYAPGAQDRADKARAEGRAFHESGREIKLPRIPDNQWVSRDSSSGVRLRQVRCPEGGQEHIETAFPNR